MHEGESEIIEIIEPYISELISLLAVVVSVVAGVRAYKANKLAEQLAKDLEIEKKAIRRAELIISEEQKVAASKRLTMVLGQKLELLKGNSTLNELYPGEQERIMQCLSVLKDQNEQQDLVYKLLDSPSTGDDVVLSKTAFADRERLRIRMQADFENELMSLESMKARQSA